MKLQKTIENAEKTSKAGKAKCFYVLLSTYIYKQMFLFPGDSGAEMKKEVERINKEIKVSWYYVQNTKQFFKNSFEPAGIISSLAWSISSLWLGVLAHSCNPSYREARTVRWLEV